MRQKTPFSVVENDIKKCVFVSENEGPDQGMPWPDGPPSSDCPVGWHADDAPRRHRVRDRYLPKTRECVSPFPQGLFMPPKTRPKAFSAAKMLFWLGKHTLIAPIPTYVGICMSPFPQGFSMPPKHAPRCFCAAKMLFWGNQAAGAGGTGGRRWGNRPPDTHQPIPLKRK